MNFQGVVIKRQNDFFVQTNDERVKQKVYPLSSYSTAIEGETIDFKLIPNNSESDEQIEYIARRINLKTVK